MIYLRPRYLQYKKQKPNASVCTLAMSTLGKPIGETGRAGCCSSMTNNFRSFRSARSTVGESLAPQAVNRFGSVASSSPGRVVDDYKLGTMYEADDDVAAEPSPEEGKASADDFVDEPSPEEGKASATGEAAE